MNEPAAKAAKRPKLVKPRLAPPVPVKSLVKGFIAAAVDLGLSLMPWQEWAGRYLTAVDADGNWRFREVGIVVARQNGKTSLLLPLIVQRLLLGHKIIHTAQNRTMPRETFLEVAAWGADRDDVEYIRQANGQETIQMKNGGRYTLVAPRPGVRGHAMDTIILDEVREQQNNELMQAIKPTITASLNPQIIYLSNAGDVSSVVLNDLKRRGTDGITERLAYIEWSAAPERAIDDLIGWKEANPALGITIQLDTLRNLFESSQPTAFETEHLCRWVRTMRARIVSESQWDQSRTDDLSVPVRPYMAVSVSPDAKRASVVLSWQQDDGTFALDIVEDIADDLDLEALGKALRDRARKAGVVQTAYSAWTDTPLARYLPNAKVVDGKDLANGSVNFARLVDSGFIRWRGADTISNDLSWLARKAHESGAWSATPIDDEHSTTAALAAIRALWLASAPKPPSPRVL